MHLPSLHGSPVPLNSYLWKQSIEYSVILLLNIRDGGGEVEDRCFIEMFQGYEDEFSQVFIGGEMSDRGW